ncbi:hypothetical protein BD560DRAFT_407368 [Blakeslea trispora]|nr:hypothetical protein BD560DRAFT_407368 [Blakeslea trispora]
MKIPGIHSERLFTIFSKPSNLRQTTDLFNIKILPNQTLDNRFALITSKKKISKSAVIRNRADRRLKAALQAEHDTIKIKGYDFLFYLKPDLVTAPWKTIIHELSSSLEKIQSMSVNQSKKKTFKKPKSHDKA